MTELTLEQLKRAIPAATIENLKRFLKPVNDAMARYDINTPMRAAHFLCQIAWESVSLRYTEEIASGTAYDTGRLAAASVFAVMRTRRMRVRAYGMATIRFPTPRIAITAARQR